MLLKHGILKKLVTYIQIQNYAQVCIIPHLHKCANVMDFLCLLRVEVRSRNYTEAEYRITKYKLLPCVTVLDIR